jgi:hypothetical protein
MTHLQLDHDFTYYQDSYGFDESLDDIDAVEFCDNYFPEYNYYEPYEFQYNEWCMDTYDFSLDINSIIKYIDRKTNEALSQEDLQKLEKDWKH